MSDEQQQQPVQVHVVTREPVVEITLKAIYDEVIATKAMVTPLPTVVSDHETRIRVLEAFKERSSGARALLNGVLYVSGGSLLGFVLTHVVK